MADVIINTTAMIQADLAFIRAGGATANRVHTAIRRYLFIIEMQKEHVNEGLEYSSVWDRGTEWELTDPGYSVQSGGPPSDNIITLRPRID